MNTDRSSLNVHTAYQYISDDDVTADASVRSATSSESFSHLEPYEPVSFKTGPKLSPNGPIQDRTLPRPPGETMTGHGSPYKKGLSASDPHLNNPPRVVYDVPRHSYKSGTLDAWTSKSDDVFYENNDSLPR